MEKNIFLCHGDVNLFYRTISNISQKENNVNLKGIFLLDRKKFCFQ